MADENIEAIEQEIKIGARNSAADQRRIQDAHDTLVGLGAVCMDKPEVETIPMRSIDPDALVMFGGEVKALEGGKVAGYLVRFSTAADPDLTGDYFTAETDFGEAAQSDTYYHHGLDAKMGQRVIGKGTLKKDDVGVWIEAQLNMRDKYEQAVFEMARAGKLGWSSGTLGHLVTREQDGKSSRITKWPLGLDASLTPTPAEPRNAAVSLKSLVSPAEAKPEATGDVAANKAAINNPIAVESSNESEEVTNTMDENEVKTLSDGLASLKADIAALKAALPVVNDGGHTVEVTHDEADNPFKSIAEQCAAVKSFEVSKGRTMDPRLGRLEVKAPAGASEGVADDGGFLLEPTLAAEILAPMHEEGPFTNAVRRLPVGSNSNYGYINGVNETSRATGSRWGGVQGYRLAEAGSITASRPKFRRINWELKKSGVACYATDELLRDAAMFSAIVRQAAAEELSFMTNDDIFEGAGLGGPLGVMVSPCLISVAKEAGQGADTIVNENLMKMWARMPARNKRNAAWYINTDCNPQLDLLALTTGVGTLEPRFVTYGPDGIMRIKGRPVIETEFSSTLGDLGDILLADFSEYLFWDKDGVQGASSIHLQFLTDETVFRFLYRCDGQPAIAAPLTPFKGAGNTVSPFVTLAERA